MTRVLENNTGLAGECQEEDPFAPAYLVIRGGVALWRCQHNPSHEVPA